FQDQRRKRGEITFAIDAVLAAAPQTAVEGLDDPHRRLLRAPGIRCCVVIGKKTRDGSLTRFPCCLAAADAVGNRILRAAVRPPYPDFPVCCPLRCAAQNESVTPIANVP